MSDKREAPNHLSETLDKEITRLLRDTSAELSSLGGPDMTITSGTIDTKSLHKSE